MLDERTKFFRTSGVTLVEIMVVVLLSSMVLVSASHVMSRTTVTFKKGSDMLNTQIILDTVVERIRSDIRSLKEMEGWTDKKLSFSAFQRNEEKKITYLMNPQQKTLIREEDGPSGKKTTKFGAEGKIENLTFKWIPEKDLGDGKQEDPYLRLVIQIISNEPGDGTPSKLNFVCNFHSKCLSGMKLPEKLVPPNLTKN